MKEIWKDVEGYEGRYMISNLGNVYSIKKNHRGGMLKILVLNRYGLDYKFVCLFKDGRKRTAYIHRLVAKAFIPNPENKPHIDHINCNSMDNRIENLRWVTPKENANNPITILKRRYNVNRHNKQICVKELDENENVINTFYSFRDAGRRTGIPYTNIICACKSKSHKTHGRYFCC